MLVTYLKITLNKIGQGEYRILRVHKEKYAEDRGKWKRKAEAKTC